MKREEAIDILSSYLMFDKSNKQIDIALDMAIEALSEDISDDGTLKVKVKDGSKVNRVLVLGDNNFGGLYYPDRLTEANGHKVEYDSENESGDAE